MNQRVSALGEATSLHERKRRAGQRMIIGIPGPKVDDDVRKLVRELRPAGFILFARNVEEPRQVLELNRELASLIDPAYPPLLTVDQEGGRVQRVRSPATVWPSMRVVAQSGLAREVAAALAIELRAMGFNLNFAPVADVDSNPKNPVIGDRAFAADSRKVCELVQTFVREQQAQGIMACAKHFPGHGDTSKDSHLELPFVEKEEPDLRETELKPFKAAIDSGVATLMSAHVVYPAWDEEHPATLSSRIIPRLVREEMRFDGVIFSDDLDMKAVMGRYPIREQVERATAATIDVFLCCNTLDVQLQTFESLMYAQEADPGFVRACETSEKRLMRLRERFLLQRRADISLDRVGCAEHRALADTAARRGNG